MAKPGLTQVTTAQTFQAWLDKTNDIVDIVASDAITASALGDTTTGNATLVGSFTANTVIAFNTLRADTFSPKSGSTSISATAPINTTTSLQVAQTLTSTSGPRLNFSSTTNVWRTGFEDTTDNTFVIDFGSGTPKLRISTTGNLSTAGSIAAGTGGFVGNLTGNLAGNVTGNLTGNVTGNADTVTNGVYTVGNQTIDGTKTFSSTIVGSINGNSATVTNGVYTVGNQTIGGTKTFSSTIVGSINGNAATVTNGVYTSRLISTGGGLTGGGNLSTDRTISVDFANSSDAITGTSATKVMNPARTVDAINQAGVKGFIVFNGSTGAVLKSRNLTLTKSGTGNYSLTCDVSIRDGSSNWGVVITNIDNGVLSQIPVSINSSTVNSFQTEFQNIFVTSRTSAGFVVRAKTTTSQWYSFLVGNDNGGGNAFGISAVDPTYVALIVF